MCPLRVEVHTFAYVFLPPALSYKESLFLYYTRIY